MIAQVSFYGRDAIHLDCDAIALLYIFFSTFLNSALVSASTLAQWNCSLSIHSLPVRVSMMARSGRARPPP